MYGGGGGVLFDVSIHFQPHKPSHKEGRKSETENRMRINERVLFALNLCMRTKYFFSTLRFWHPNF